MGIDFWAEHYRHTDQMSPELYEIRKSCLVYGLGRPRLKSMHREGSQRDRARRPRTESRAGRPTAYFRTGNAFTDFYKGYHRY